VNQVEIDNCKTVNYKTRHIFYCGVEL